MNAFGPKFSRLVQLAAVTLVAATAVAQAPPKYDPTTETTFKGVVGELKLVPPTGGKPVAYLILKSTPDAQVFLCPKKFLDDIGVVFKVDDEIEITGSKVKQEGVDLTLAREVVKGGETLTLRFKDGKPAW
jgi:hypothetical protein